MASPFRDTIRAAAEEEGHVGIPGNMGWKIPAIADAVLEDKIRHAHPIGTVELTCPFCKGLRQMNCYRIADGPFGTRKALHFLCPTCGGNWTVDKSENEKILASIKPGNSGDQGAA